MHVWHFSCGYVVCSQTPAHSEIWYQDRISLSYYSQILLPLCAWVPCKWAQAGRKERGREGGRRLSGRKRNTIRGRERPRGNERKRERWRGEEEGERARGRLGRREEQRRVSVTSRWECFCPSFHYLPVSLPGSPQHRRYARGIFKRTPIHTHTHAPSLPLSLHPLLFTELDREG